MGTAKNTKKRGYHHRPFKKEGERFVNPYNKNQKRRFLDFCLWQFGYYKDKKEPKSIPEDFSYPNPKKRLKKSSPKVTWINHSTFLVNIDGLHVLTDPIWSERCSPLDFLGPKRKHEPSVDFRKLPFIDVVLISHDHYDHLDKKTVKTLNKRHPGITWIIPLGLKAWFKKQGIDHVIELSWWEQCDFTTIRIPNLTVKITAVPSQHFSGRGLFDKNRSLWTGYVAEFERKKKDTKRFYFVGDTGYNKKDFKAIGEKFSKIDLSLIPIGTYTPYSFMEPVHISPEKAVKIHNEVNSSLSVGMHWKTFKLSEEGANQPPYDLHCSLEKAKINHENFRVLDPGQTINW